MTDDREAREAVFSAKSIDRFLLNIDKRGEDECWPWTGKLHGGYGHFHADGVGMKAHRASFAIFRKPPGAGMCIDHQCRNRACVNPRHLREVSPRVNTLENSIAPTALNAAKTHCLRGHPLAGENLMHRINGWRGCRICRQASLARSNARRSQRKLLVAGPSPATTGEAA